MVEKCCFPEVLSLLDHLSHIRKVSQSFTFKMQFRAVGRSFGPTGGSYAPGIIYPCMYN